MVVIFGGIVTFRPMYIAYKGHDMQSYCVWWMMVNVEGSRQVYIAT